MVKKTSVQETDGETDQLLQTRAAAVLVEKLKEFRQSYNRTHGQVCEFFEQAHVVEKIYHHSPGPAKTNSLTQCEKKPDESENEDEGCNEQKTWSIKQKLNSWRAVMREVVCDVCPSLQLENQPDINPGLMKHVLDEIRKLKTELAFQHNTILELTHQLENHQGKNQRKERLIEKLLLRSREIRLEGHSGEEGKILFGPDGKEDLIHHHQHQHEIFDSFDQDDCITFGDLGDLPLELEDMASQYLAKMNEAKEEAKVVTRQRTPVSHQPPTTATDTAQETHCHSLLAERKNEDSPAHAVNVIEDETGDSTNNDASSRSEIQEVSAFVRRTPIPTPSSGDAPSENVRWKNRRAVLVVCGRLCCAYVACRVLQRGSSKK